MLTERILFQNRGLPFSFLIDPPSPSVCQKGTIFPFLFRNPSLSLTFFHRFTHYFVKGRLNNVRKTVLFLHFYKNLKMTAKINNFPIEGMGHFRSNFVCTFFGALNGVLDDLLNKCRYQIS